jgi:predicted NBD/HSP70 family sugar kinase
VMEEGAENSTGGRPGIRLRLDARHLLSMGVDILNWETQIATGTMGGQMIHTSRHRTPPTPFETLDLIAEHFAAERKRVGQALYGVGVTTRGFVNSDSGVVELGNAPGWAGIKVAEVLSQRLKTPVFVENDVRAAAIAEYHHGGSDIHGSHCMLFVKVGEGVGTGIVLDGRLHRGPHMAAGEIGQMVVADPPDTGGVQAHDSPGCVEALASNPAICERYRRLAGNRQHRSSAGGDSTALVKRICHLAMEGDAAAQETLRETSRYLGRGIANAVWLLDADVVVIDGAIAEAWPLLADGIRTQFPGAEFPNFRSLILRPSALGGQATMMAAAGLPFAGLFSTGELV